MAGAMNKANQRQAQKSKTKKNYGLKKVRMHNIPVVCTNCNQTLELSSIVAYKEGGNNCPRCKSKLSFNLSKFEHKVAKI